MLVVKKNQRQKSLNYWQKRQEDILSYLDRTDLDVFSELQKLYNEQAFELQKELFDFYTKYSEENKMTYQDVVKKLRHEDLSDYVANANKYRKQAEKDPELLKRLNEQYVSARATRMDALNLELVYRAGILKGVLDSAFENHLKKVASYAYKKAMGGRSGTINGPVLEELVRTPFDGYNYSEQLWGNTDNLVKNLQKRLKQGFVRGEHPRAMARDLAKRFNVANHRAETLIRTDGTMVINN
ncbi:TPA: phage head morphogenesis protein, partial [Streptococcus pyogenes]|nr:phage head morphogenesis protein [Streptococcus pyogenes]